MTAFLSLALLAALTQPAPALAAKPIRVTGGDADATHVVVNLPAPEGVEPLMLMNAPGVSVPAVVVDGTLTFVVPKLKANETLTFTPSSVSNVRLKMFSFADSPEGYTDILYGKPVARFVTKKHDASSPESHFLTFKPFHHVFDPASGKVLITSGAYPSPTDKSVLYPHHRGIFFGWKAGYNGKIADTWHGTKGVYSEVEKELAREANPVFARQKVLIRWVGTDGLQFAEEERQLTAYAVGEDATMLDFESKVTTKLPKVTLDGDPQHAGVHFRAAQDVNANKGQTVYTRPDGQDKPGKTRNYPAQKTHVNLPWDAMTYTTGGKQYTTVLVDRPENPKESRWSERDYGRFGSYFVADVTPKKPVIVKYRFYIKGGGVSVPECQAIAAGYTEDVKPAVK